MNSFRIRKADTKDYGNIFQLLQKFALFQKTPEKLTITVEQMKENKGSFHCLVAEVENNLIAGFVTYFPAYYSWSGKAFYIDDLYVTKPFRSQGIGKALLQSVFDKARQNNCKKVRWQVSGWNKDAINFYKSLGAVIDDTEQNCDLML